MFTECHCTCDKGTVLSALTSPLMKVAAPSPWMTQVSSEFCTQQSTLVSVILGEGSSSPGARDDYTTSCPYQHLHTGSSSDVYA